MTSDSRRGLGADVIGVSLDLTASVGMKQATESQSVLVFVLRVCWGGGGTGD